MAAPNILYLHGFASSPYGSKATYFAEQLAAFGIELVRPDLNVPSFEKLTLTAMIEKVAETVAACPPGPVYLIGSSFGGLGALHFYDKRRSAEAGRVEKILFLAPGFTAFRDRPLFRLWWKWLGSIPFMHYGYGDRRRVHYGLVADIWQYDSYAVQLDIPARIIHGRQDRVVDPLQSMCFKEVNPHVDLRLIDTDHQMGGAVDVLWAEMVEFFGIGRD
jgi:pimeloyl-ACP methyl ester carboxylesterase